MLVAVASCFELVILFSQFISFLQGEVEFSFDIVNLFLGFKHLLEDLVLKFSLFGFKTFFVRRSPVHPFDIFNSQ